MIISTSNVDFNVETVGDIYKETPIVLLHGFMGSLENWNQIKLQFNIPIILIDLPGHGKSHFKKIDNYSFTDWATDFKYILDKLNLNQINLCGYSMGGRLAISFACRFPMIVNKLILESSTPGIDNEIERKNRFEIDKLNCTKIMSDYTNFVEDWCQNIFFANQKQRNLSGWEAQQEIRLRQNPAQLSSSIEFLGTGKMPSLWKKINTLHSAVMLITGSEDSQYCRIAVECLKEIKDSKWMNISNCGHNIHLEQSDQFVECVKSFLKS